MMSKLAIEDLVLPTYNVRMQIFQALCVLPRLDSSVFAKISRQHGLGLQQPLGSSPLETLTTDRATLLDSLAPLYSTTLHNLAHQPPAIDQFCGRRGIKDRWAVCGVGALSPRSFIRLTLVFRQIVARSLSGCCSFLVRALLLSVLFPLFSGSLQSRSLLSLLRRAEQHVLNHDGPGA